MLSPLFFDGLYKNCFFSGKNSKINDIDILSFIVVYKYDL